MEESDFDESHALDMALNDAVRKLQTVRMRQANESDYVQVREFKLKYFESIEEYEFDIYGKYKGELVMINKEDFNNAIL